MTKINLDPTDMMVEAILTWSSNGNMYRIHTKMTVMKGVTLPLVSKSFVLLIVHLLFSEKRCRLYVHCPYFFSMFSYLYNQSSHVTSVPLLAPGFPSTIKWLCLCVVLN